MPFYSEVYGAVQDPQDGDLSSLHKSECVQSFHPKSYHEWEAYHNSHSASAFVFNLSIKKLSSELKSRIENNANELKVIESQMKQTISASSQLTKLLKSNLNLSSSARAPFTKKLSGLSRTDSIPQRGESMTPTTSKSEKTTSTSTTPVSLEKSSTPIIKTPGAQSPSTPAPVGENVEAQSPPKAPTLKTTEKCLGHEGKGEHKKNDEKDDATAMKFDTDFCISETLGNQNLSELSKAQQVDGSVMIATTGRPAITPVEALARCLSFEITVIEQHSNLVDEEVLPSLQSLIVQYSSAGRMALEVLRQKSSQLKTDLAVTTKQWKEFRVVLQVSQFSRCLFPSGFYFRRPFSCSLKSG